MTRESFYTRSLHGFMEYCFGRLRAASRAQVDLSETRVLQRLRQDPMWESDSPLFEAAPSPLTVASAFRRKSPARWVPVAAAAVTVIAAVGTAMMWRPADNTLFRLAEGDVHRQGGTVRSNGGGGAVLALTDGSRVEMRSQSELSLERANDGLRIRLIRGGIIVDAAPQRTGHLYVQTKEVTVSVVGTVFLVNADEHGSHVAVIEGEVRVQQGTTEQTLRQGEQVATNPSMPSLPVNEEVAWSRQAVAHVALLQQATVPQLPFRPAPKDERVHFEVVSIRPSDSSSEPGARGGGDGSGSGVNQWGCGISSPTIDPRRFSVTKTTVYTLIVWGYGSKGLNAPGCGMDSRLNLISGGPDWIRSDLFDVVAAIPEGSSVGTRESRDSGNVAVIRQMIQAMLAETFKLTVRRGIREMPVYSLTVTQDALRNAAASGPALWLTQGDARPEDKLLGGSLRDPGVMGDTGIRNGEVMQVVRGRNASIAELATYLGPPMGRTVLDRTGLVGRFNFDVWAAPTDYGILTGLFRSVPKATSPTIFAALADAGLRLEPAKAPLEVLLIDRVERPSAN